MFAEESLLMASPDTVTAPERETEGAGNGAR